MGLIHRVKYVRQARVVGVNQAVLGQVERQVVDVRHVERALRHAGNGRQHSRAHLEAGHLHRGAVNALVRRPRELLDEDVDDLRAVLGEVGRS